MRWSVADLKSLLERAAEWAMQREGESDCWRLSYTREAIRHYVMTQEPDIFSRELTYQAAVTKRFAKVESNLLLLTPTPFVQRVADQLHHIDFPPEAVFRSGLTDRNSEGFGQLQRTLAGSADEVLEKFALICVLKENWIENEFAAGVNVFKYMSFAKLFNGMGMEELLGRYKKAKEAVEGGWFKLIHQRLKVTMRCFRTCTCCRAATYASPSRPSCNCWTNAPPNTSPTRTSRRTTTRN